MISSSIGIQSSSDDGPNSPGYIIGFAATSGDAQAVLTWTAPASNGGSAITDYTVQYSSDSGSNWSTFSDGVSASTGAIVTSLTNGTSYVFRVRAVNAIGNGPYTLQSAEVVVGAASATINTATDSTAAPSVTTNDPSIQSFANSTAVTFTSSNTWTNPYPTGATNGTATMSGSTTAGTLSMVYGTTAGGPYPSTATSGVQVTGLTRGTTYYFKAYALNSSCSISVAGVLNANGASTTVTFEYGTVSGGPYPNSVTATGSPATGTSDTPVSATLSSLSPGTYYVRIKGVNSRGTFYSSQTQVVVASTSAYGVQKSFTPPSVTQITNLIVIGGGGAGDCGGGGGGQGRSWASFAVDSSTYQIIVGGGGGYSEFVNSTYRSLPGNDGLTATIFQTPNGGTSGNGNAGGEGVVNINGDFVSGGGGGAGGVGQNGAFNTNGGNGGASSTVDGYGYGGGGGGSWFSQPVNGVYLFGGSGGTYGGVGASQSSIAFPGTANRGGGGGGGTPDEPPANGGSGYVRFYYLGP